VASVFIIPLGPVYGRKRIDTRVNIIFVLSKQGGRFHKCKQREKKKRFESGLLKTSRALYRRL